MENPKGSAQHAPGPWRESAVVGVVECTNKRGESEVVAQCYGEAGEAADRAAFIVRACNAHAELLAALKAAALWAQRNPHRAGSLDVRGIAAAIAKAEVRS